ncbi:MAG: GNAT family N-acetyltransferase [Clostridia bacterium]|nr:GNAT family N-acetyltransferase [Clostridia bacterium]
MHITDFLPCHAAAASLIAKKQYNELKSLIPCLPADPPFPALENLANGLGVAAYEGEQMVGYLCAWEPFPHMFGTRWPGVFSPVEAHGVTGENPVRIWQKLYQAAAEKWEKAGAAYHAVALWQHDVPGREALFGYGFGKRCADSIRETLPLDAPSVPGICCTELPPGSGKLVRHLRAGTYRHLQNSPCFLSGSEAIMNRWLDHIQDRPVRLFAALQDETPIAYMELSQDGENFVTEAPGILNICGAHCLPPFRGTGVSRMLLSFILRTLQAENIPLLGVDYETMNPTAIGFWEKYFTPYTISLVRRIDSIG